MLRYLLHFSPFLHCCSILDRYTILPMLSFTWCNGCVKLFSAFLSLCSLSFFLSLCSLSFSFFLSLCSLSFSFFLSLCSLSFSFFLSLSLCSLFLWELLSFLHSGNREKERVHLEWWWFAKTLFYSFSWKRCWTEREWESREGIDERRKDEKMDVKHLRKVSGFDGCIIIHPCSNLSHQLPPFSSSTLSLL